MGGGASDGCGRVSQGAGDADAARYLDRERPHHHLLARDRVLDVTAGGPGGGRSSLSRLRRDRPITADVLIDYLARAAINA